MFATDVSNAPQYDLYVDNSIFDGLDQKRYLSSCSDFGSGASLGLTSGISASTTYNVSLRHASSSSSITLTTDDISINGFGLTENSISKCDSFPFKDKKSIFFIFERESLKLLHYGQKELYSY